LAFNGNFLLNDIGSGFEVTSAMISGLAENLQQVQEGISIKFHGGTSHGYRFVFRKHPSTESYLDDTQGMSLYTVLNVQLHISPIANGLNAADSQVPRDLHTHPLKPALSAIAFRGILTADDQQNFRPDDAITRAEFASALARCVHLNAPMPDSLQIADVDTETMTDQEIARVVAAGFLSLSNKKQFEPDKLLAPNEARDALSKLVLLSRTTPDPELDGFIRESLTDKEDRIPRSTIGRLLHKILRLPE
jgi:S-layer homology domain